MNDIRIIEGGARITGARFAVIVARFYAEVGDALTRGAVDTLRAAGADGADIHVIHVPGAWELPLAARRAAGNGQYDAIIALGCVIRGETAHFDYVCTEASRGLAAVGEDCGLPVGFGLLTAENRTQAEARAGGEKGNKGVEAASAAIEMINLLRRIG